MPAAPNPTGQLYAAPPATPGNLQGAPSQQGVGPYGQLPQIPSPTSTQASAISGNMGNLSSLYGLGYGLNTNIATQAALPYQLNLPNYGAMTGQNSSNILSLLQGQVPQDVANQIAQMGAERGVSTGSIGSPNSNAALLQSLGLTSLGLQSTGAQELGQAIQQTPTGQQFNLSSFLNSPDTYQQAQTAANLISAAPNPTSAAQLNLATALFGNQLGRQQGPQASPLSPMSYSTPTTPDVLPPATLPLGGQNPPAGTQGYLGNQYDSPIGPPNSFQPGDFEAMGFSDDQSLDFSNPDLFSGDLFGG